jgi:DNA-directed RNA polymerase specialized sigma24 family protein
VCAWFREIESEDIAQQILTLFLELVDSASPPQITSHLPIALMRALRRGAFRWAENEKRHVIQREADKSQEIAEPFGNDTFETVSVLNDFLDHCGRIGILSEFERDLLIRLKLEGFFAKEIIQTHTALSEKAVHWRVERILQRLQKAANDLGIKKAPLSFSVSSQHLQERKNRNNVREKTRIFSLRTFSDFLPISKSRRQLSLDSSPKQSESKQPQFAAPQRNLSPTTPTLSSASGRTCVIQGTASQRLAAIRSSVFPPTLARHTKFGERLSSNPDAGLARIIRKELAGNEEILPQEICFPLALARVRHIFLVHPVRHGRLRPNYGHVALGERRNRLDDSLHDRYCAWSFTRRHRGRGLDLRFW